MLPYTLLLWLPLVIASECPLAKRSADLQISSIVAQCGKYGRQQGAAMCSQASNLEMAGFTLKRDTPAYGHYMSTYVDDKLEAYHTSLAVLQATLAYKKSLGGGYDNTPNTFLHFLLSQGYVAGPYKVCAPTVSCSQGYDAKYRTYDGSCNNLRYIRWGQAKTAYSRLLAPSYGDDVMTPRNSVTGYELPSARQISALLFDDKFVPDPLWTVQFMQFGQFVTHDMSQAPAAHYGKDGIQCCTPDGGAVLPEHYLHHACYPIIIPSDDSFFWQFGQRCMNFVRTMTVAHPDCRLGPAEQMNAVTHFLDLSQVYGSSEVVAKHLRTFSGGMLRYQNQGGHIVLPSALGHEGYECDAKCPSGACYQAGDTRVNQNLGLATLHIVFLRMHNWLAAELHVVNPHWDDEYLYQEARRILIAIYQHIVYNEYLQIVLGWDWSIEHNIIARPGQYGGTTGYNDYVNPSVLNEHATGAFRYLHSTVNGHSNLYDGFGLYNGSTRLSDHLHCPAFLQQAPFLMDYYVRGTVASPMEKADNYYSREITWFLFASGKPFGLDLESFDIQRSRDHGLHSYNDYRVLCGIPRAYTFSDLLDVMSEEAVSKLAFLYRSVDDLDLTVAFLERHVDDAQFGPTLRCIAGEQFYRTRVGDRFFFEHRGLPTSFTDHQLAEIHKFSLSKLLCQNSDYIRLIQPQAFRLQYESNPLVNCDSLPGIDLMAWHQAPSY